MATLETNATVESLTAINGTKTRHHEWHLLASIGTFKQVNLLATTYIGLKSLMAIRTGKPLSASVIVNTAALLKEHDLSSEHLNALLHGTSPEQLLGQSWPRDLCGTWREVMRHYSADGTPPPPTTKERIAGQMLDATLHATASRRGGAPSHRTLSKSQLQQALDHIREGQEQQTLLGALGVLVCLTTFSVGVVADLRLKSRSLDASWLAQIDVETGLLSVDYSFIAHEAAVPIMGAIPASYICTRPLPKILTNDLRARAEKYPHAKTLKELYPNEAVPAHDSLVFACKDQIQPTWARLRRSMGTYLRKEGFDNFLASVMSGDFTHVPRSKLYYACATASEIATAFDRFYKLVGWSEPGFLPSQTIAFGCQVVPTMESLTALDQHWQGKVKDSHPGKHCSPDNLMKFHNNFMCWNAMRLSLLLALRESTEITLSAAVDEKHDRWIPIHDKHVPGDYGATPVPLTQWVALSNEV
ncbi:MAG: hypothetical protein P4L87_04280 [Formivibrio sp.]|nr:hypothetical protein [Formivibrio sp.]